MKFTLEIIDPLKKRPKKIGLGELSTRIEQDTVALFVRDSGPAEYLYSAKIYQVGMDSIILSGFSATKFNYIKWILRREK